MKAKELVVYIETIPMDKRTTKLIEAVSRVNKGDYTVESVVVCQKSKVHVPWLAYAVVTGPRGGKILVDNFNIQRMARFWAKQNRLDTDRVGFGGWEDWVKSSATKSGKLHTLSYDIDSSDKALKKLAREQGMRSVIRLDNDELYYTIRAGVNYTEWPNVLY